MKIRACYEPMNQRIGLYFTLIDNNEHYETVLVKKKKIGRFENIKPTVSVDNKSELQDLIDDLWSMGLRPSARSDEYKAQLCTMRDHLNDMRTLVFKKRDDLV